MRSIKLLENISEKFKKDIIESVQSAIGDDIKLDMKVNELDTDNGNPMRIWDFINRNIGKKFSEDDFIITGVTQRGSWKMKFIFDKKLGILYTLMREERFESVRKEVPKRKTIHYCQALAEAFNKGLTAKEEQMCLFKNQDYYDTDKVNEIVNKIIMDLSIPENIVKNHAIILFEGKNYELESIRCCVVNSNLSIVEEADWSHSIEFNESTIMDVVEDSEVKSENPSNGLKFRQKAKDKIGQKSLAERKEQESGLKTVK